MIFCNKSQFHTVLEFTGGIWSVRDAGLNKWTDKQKIMCILNRAFNNFSGYDDHSQLRAAQHKQTNRHTPGHLKDFICLDRGWLCENVSLHLQRIRSQAACDHFIGQRHLK